MLRPIIHGISPDLREKVLQPVQPIGPTAQVVLLVLGPFESRVRQIESRSLVGRGEKEIHMRHLGCACPLAREGEFWGRKTSSYVPWDSMVSLSGSSIPRRKLPSGRGSTVAQYRHPAGAIHKEIRAGSVQDTNTSCGGTLKVLDTDARVPDILTPSPEGADFQFQVSSPRVTPILRPPGLPRTREGPDEYQAPTR